MKKSGMNTNGGFNTVDCQSGSEQDPQSMKSTTISDVARVAGVSLGTVSRVLNNRNGKIKISDGTREKVLNIAKELGYRPNPFATALRRQKTGVIGAIIRDIEDPFLRQVIREVQKAAHAKDIELLIGHAAHELGTAERQLNLMMSRWFDGLLLIGNLTGDGRFIRILKKSSIPFVTVASGFDIDIPTVNYDNVYGTRTALNYLYGLGHRRIAFIGNLEHAGVRERLEVFNEFVKQRSLFWQSEYLHLKSNTRNSALLCTKELLSLPSPPTAILCSSDLLALGAMSGAWQKGLQVPKNISILGYDDIEESVDAYSPLTTIRQPVDITAEKAVEMLLSVIENPLNDELNKDIVIRPELVVRSSCSTPNE